MQRSILYILNDPSGDEGIPKVTTTPRSELLADLLRSELLECDRKQIGFADVQLFGPKELNVRYCKDRIDGLRIQSQMHLLKARV